MRLGGLWQGLSGRSALARTRALAHLQRVQADGGTVPDINRLIVFLTMLNDRQLAELALVADPHVFGYKLGASSTSVSKVYSLIPEGDLVQTTAASQPLLLPHDGVNNYWSNQGIAGNFVSTPDAVVNRITGDIDISVKVDIRTLSGARYGIIGKYDGDSNQRGYALCVVNNTLEFIFSLNGTGSVPNYVSSPITTGIKWYRVVRVSSTGVITYYSSADGISWDLISSITATAGSLFSSTAVVDVAGKQFISSPVKVYSARIYNGIRENGGQLAVSFDANDYRRYQSSDQNSFISSLTGEKWTINRDSNLTGYKGMLVDRTAVISDGVDDYMESGDVARTGPETIYAIHQRFVDRFGGILNSKASFTAVRLLYTHEVQCTILRTNGQSAPYTSGIIENPSASSFPKNTRTLTTAIFNGANSSLQNYGGTKLTGNVGGIGTGYCVFHAPQAVLTGEVFPILVSKTADTTAQQKAIHDFVLSKLNLHIDADAQAHYDRVTADGGTILSLPRLSDAVKYLKSIRPLAEFAMVVDPHIFGYKVGATSTSISKLYSLDSASDLIQSTAAAQPVLHEWRGENYWYSSGVVGNHISTPSSVSNQITGNIDISAKIDLAAGAARTICSKVEYVPGGRSYALEINNSFLVLRFAVVDGSTIVVTSTVPIPAGTKFVRSTRVASSGVVNHYISADGDTWTPLGTSITSTTGAITNSSTSVLIGSAVGGQPYVGGIYSVKIYNGLRESGGTLAVNFDANDYRKTDPTNQSSWVASTTGEMWTISTDSNATGYKGVLVDRTMFQTDGTDDNLKTGAMTLNQPVSMYLPVNVFNGGGANRRIYDGLSGANAIEVTPTNSLFMFSSGLGLTGGATTYEKFLLLTGIHNGVNSTMSINGNTAATGDAGTNTPGGFTIGSTRINSLYINALYSTIIATRTADTPAQQALLNNYLRGIHNKLY